MRSAKHSSNGDRSAELEFLAAQIENLQRTLAHSPPANRPAIEARIDAARAKIKQLSAPEAS